MERETTEAVFAILNFLIANKAESLEAIELSLREIVDSEATVSAYMGFLNQTWHIEAGKDSEPTLVMGPVSVCYGSTHDLLAELNLNNEHGANALALLKSMGMIQQLGPGKGKVVLLLNEPRIQHSEPPIQPVGRVEKDESEEIERLRNRVQELTEANRAITSDLRVARASTWG